MATTASSLLPAALTGHGEEGLIAWVLVAAAGSGALLCLYLTLVWALASTVLIAGPATRVGAALLAALRLLAPRMARRVAVSAAVATTATGLALVPATAASPDAQSSGAASPSFAMSSELTPSAPSESDPDPEAAAPASSEEDEGTLPGLGWGDGPAASGHTDPEGQNSRPADGASDPEPTEEPGASPGAGNAPDSGPDATGSSPRTEGTVIVRPGDNLWSITDDLLGTAPDDPADIAAAWPLLYEANRGEVGTDPDHLEPGQELTVPSTIPIQEQP
ncbi:LysM peptidoglycan-binding domain-containing protein [Brachybacterium sp. GCM10030267]|uniref:LysM peptidoglycan-binding domain-containing protein n=1 Tax=unclassified Brachybacterium TaxID=2623841 RepID=UPI00360DC7D4